VTNAPPAPARRLPRVVLTAAVIVQVALTFALFQGHLSSLTITNARHLQPLALVPFVVAVLALSRAGLSPRAAAWLVLAVTAALQVIALLQPPQTSDDDLRYIWDGKVQLAGVDPYRYVPNDPALVRLHEPALFTNQDCDLPTGCAMLNRPTVHTVYPPVAQVSFDLVRVLSLGGRAAHRGQQAFQVAAAIGVVLMTWLLLRTGRRRGSPTWWAALWGWSPIVVSELGNNAHIDWVAILLCFGALTIYAAGRPAWAGALLGAAVATKLYPVLVAPALLRRHPVKVITAALAVIVAGYVPHVAAVGGKVIGYLPGYLQEEGYDSGSRLLLIGRIVPHPYDTLLGATLLAVLGLWCLRRVDPGRPEFSAVWLVGAAFLIMTPHYGWYAALLVALVAMTGQWYWIPVALAPTFAYLYGHSSAHNALIYLVAAVVTALLAAVYRFLRVPPDSVRGPSPDAEFDLVASTTGLPRSR